MTDFSEPDIPPDPMLGPDPMLDQSGMEEDAAGLAPAGDVEQGIPSPYGDTPGVQPPATGAAPGQETTGSSTQPDEAPETPGTDQTELSEPNYHPLAQADEAMRPDDGYAPTRLGGDATPGYLDYAEKKMAEYGWGPQELPALIGLWNETSSPYTQSHTGTAYWDPEADNILSRASGIPGLMPDTLEGLGYDPVKWDDPEYQMDLGFEYIKGKYDTPTKAWNAMRLQNWY